ncbi:MAG: histidine phosphatase family protein [Actinomycetota bacterium]
MGAPRGTERVAPGTGVPANPPLTAHGRDQAERVAAWLATEPIDTVLSSPQRRAIETAAPIARAHGLPIEVVDGLVEYDVQADHYIPMEELRVTKDERWDAMVEGRWGEFGGEDPKALRARVATTVDEIVDAHPGRTVVARCATAGSSMSRSPRCSGSTESCGSTPAIRRFRASSRHAPASGRSHR